MILPIFLSTLVSAETTNGEAARLLIERDVLVQRVAEIDTRLAELGVPVLTATPVTIPVYKPGFKAVKVDSFKGSDKVAGVLASHQEEFASCWAIGEHATAGSFWVDGEGRPESELTSILWNAAGGRGEFEPERIRDCYRGVLMTIWDFPRGLRAQPYQIEFIFG